MRLKSLKVYQNIHEVSGNGLRMLMQSSGSEHISGMMTVMMKWGGGGGGGEGRGRGGGTCPFVSSEEHYSSCQASKRFTVCEHRPVLSSGSVRARRPPLFWAPFQTRGRSEKKNQNQMQGGGGGGEKPFAAVTWARDVVDAKQKRRRNENESLFLSPFFLRIHKSKLNTNGGSRQQQAASGGDQMLVSPWRVQVYPCVHSFVVSEIFSKSSFTDLCHIRKRIWNQTATIRQKKKPHKVTMNWTRRYLRNRAQS